MEKTPEAPRLAATARTRGTLYTSKQSWGSQTQGTAAAAPGLAAAWAFLRPGPGSARPSPKSMSMSSDSLGKSSDPKESASVRSTSLGSSGSEDCGAWANHLP